LRSIVFLLAATALIGGCDKRSPATGQANQSNAASDVSVVTPDEATAPPDNGVDVIGTLDRKH
jgi:uncharacterized lipoprotein YajG